MTDPTHLTPAKRIERVARDERLARALRDNLHRRKEQARAQQRNSAGPAASAAPPPTSKDSEKPPA